MKCKNIQNQNSLQIHAFQTSFYGVRAQPRYYSIDSLISLFDLCFLTLIYTAASTQAANLGTFNFLGYTLKGFNNRDAGTGQMLRGYFNNTTNQFAVSVRTYGDNLDAWFNEFSRIDADTVVDSFKITLSRNSDYTNSSFSWIDGIESYSFSSSNFGAGAKLIKSLFEDILSCLGVPTSTISAMLDGLSGSVTKDALTASAWVNVNFGLLQSADFDASNVGMPVVFQLDKNDSSYVGASYYTFYSSITYRTWHWSTSANTATWAYTDAYDAACVANVTLG